MKTKYLFQCLLIILCLGFTACQEDDSPTEGPQGEQGPPGEDGEDGNANVYASPWIAEEFSDDPTAFTFFTIEDENFTQAIVNSGTVLTYGKIGSGASHVPFTYFNRAYNFGFGSGTITFSGASINYSNEIFDDFTHVRYIIIPASHSGKNEGVDFASMSYEEVMDYFGLQK